jgi:hypothetical protein
MTTKAKRFRYLSERSGPDKPKKPRRPRRDVPIDTSKPGTSAADRKAGGESTAARNRSLHASRKGVVKLEDSRTKPSRKSTRGGKGSTITIATNAEGIQKKRRGEGHLKPSSNLTLRSIVSARSPSQRAQRKGGRRGL